MNNATSPPYYDWIPGIQCYKVTQHFPGNLAQVIQYVWRCGRKTTCGIEDLEKAKVFLEFEIARLKEVRDGK